jgi:hypothetical protein
MWLLFTIEEKNPLLLVGKRKKLSDKQSAFFFSPLLFRLCVGGFGVSPPYFLCGGGVLCPTVVYSRKRERQWPVPWLIIGLIGFTSPSARAHTTICRHAHNDSTTFFFKKKRKFWLAAAPFFLLRGFCKSHDNNNNNDIFSQEKKRWCLKREGS